jgi:hypothetical protein
MAAGAHDARRHPDADGCEQARGTEHRPDRVAGGGEAAVEQDQHEGDDAHGLGERHVVEADPRQAVVADDHPDAQEYQEAGHLKTLRQAGPDQPGQEQTGAGEQDGIGGEVRVHGEAGVGVPSSLAANRRVAAGNPRFV